LQIVKSVSAGNGVIVKPEDILTYTLVVRNTGNLPATNVLLTDTVPDMTTFVDGSASPAPAINGRTLVWNAGTLLPAQVFTASFAVRVSMAVVAQQSIQNVALVSSQELTETNSNEVVNILPPSLIQLSSFNMRRVASNTVEIEWVTQSERNTFGFKLLRSTTGSTLDAERVSEMIVARGGEKVGVTYSFTDTTAPDGVLYYWLEETELDGKLNLYGPFALTVDQGPAGNLMMPRVYAPLLMR
jgi:uncharacterized repeat protein (TIGR01451 family)